MKEQSQDFMRKMQIPVMLAAGLVPVVILLYARFAVEFIMLSWIPAGVYVALALAGLFVPGKWRVAYGVGSALALLGIGVALQAVTGSIFLFLGCALFAVPAFWSVQIGRWAWHEELSLPVMISGFGIHIVAQFLMNSLKKSGAGDVVSADYSLLAAFWIYMFMAILRMNRDSLFFASHGTRRAAPSMRRQNGVFSVLLAVLAAALSAAAPVISFARQILLFLLRLLSGSGGPEETDSAGNISASEPIISTEISEEVPAPGETSLFIDKLLLILTYVICAAALFLAVVLLVRVLILLAGKLIKWLSRFTSSVSEDYVDEVMDLREDPARRESVFSRLRRRLPGFEERDASAREQIRIRYRRLQERHPQWPASSTARENLPNDLAELYEKARYSDHTVGKIDSDRFRSGSRKI